MKLFFNIDWILNDELSWKWTWCVEIASDHPILRYFLFKLRKIEICKTQKHCYWEWLFFLELSFFYWRSENLKSHMKWRSFQKFMFPIQFPNWVIENKTMKCNTEWSKEVYSLSFFHSNQKKNSRKSQISFWVGHILDLSFNLLPSI